MGATGLEGGGLFLMGGAEGDGSVEYSDGVQRGWWEVWGSVMGCSGVGGRCVVV